ncbi:MAG: type II secretion system minor pseudopilin GspJ [Woeseiaceae bacterium]
MSYVGQRAFTLIEILVAVAVFTIMSLMALQTMSSSLANSEMLTSRMDRLQAIQRSMRFLTTDLSLAAPRPVRNELGDTQLPALASSISGDFVLELTHGGWSNPAGLPRGTQQRSAYRLEEDELVRYHWNVLDRTYSNEPVATVLLDDVESLFFRFYTDAEEPSQVWPPSGPGVGNSLRSRPRAVEIVLSLSDVGEITRLIEVAP